MDSRERQKIEISDKGKRIDDLEKEREISHNLKRASEHQKEELTSIKKTVHTEAHFFNEQLQEQRRFNESMMEKMIQMAKELQKLKK